MILIRRKPDFNLNYLSIRWEPNQKLNVLNCLQKIYEVMQNSGFSFKVDEEILYGKNNYKININWNKLVG